MNAYLVRHKEDRELVGIFVCDLKQLGYYVDECTDVDLCEYVTLGAGGILWGGRAQKVPLDAGNVFDDKVKDEDFREAESLNLGDATVSEYWGPTLWGEKAKTWQDIKGDEFTQVSVDLRKAQSGRLRT